MREDLIDEGVRLMNQRKISTFSEFIEILVREECERRAGPLTEGGASQTEQVQAMVKKFLKESKISSPKSKRKGLR